MTAQLKGPLFEKFEDVMANEESREKFRDFLQTILCDELYDFYMESIAYESTNDETEKRAMGSSIINKYLSPFSSKLINVPMNLIETIKKEFDNESLDVKIFTECRKEVIKMLVMDSIPKYMDFLNNKNKLNLNVTKISITPSRSKLSSSRDIKSKSNKEIKLSKSTKDIKLSKSNKEIKLSKSEKDINKKKESPTKRNKKSIKIINKKQFKRSKSSSLIPKKEKNVPKSFDEGMNDKEIKKKFYTFLAKHFSNEYLDFYEDITEFINTQFDNEAEMKKSIDQLSSKYLGMGEENKRIVISFSFDVLGDFHEKQSSNDLKNSFSSLLSEVKVILKDQYHMFVSGNQTTKKKYELT